MGKLTDKIKLKDPGCLIGSVYGPVIAGGQGTSLKYFNINPINFLIALNLNR